MKRALLTTALITILVALLGGSAAAATVPGRAQLRGHLPELGDRPAMRVFVTQAEYDAYRNSLGDANVFPATSSLSMSFDRDILALYARGNDTGGRCIGPQVAANFSGDTLTASAPWQAGTCGAPSTAHYPFILVAFSRTAADGTAWLSSAKSICFSVDSPDTNACATLAAASPAPSATATTAPPSATSTSSPTPTRSLTPSQTVAAASPTATVAAPPASASRSPVAAASPTAGVLDSGTNFLLYAMLIAIVFLVLLSLFLSRGGRRR